MCGPGLDPGSKNFFLFPPSPLFLSYMCMFCVCVCVLFPDTALSLNTPVYFLKIKNILLHNHSAMIKIRKVVLK